MESGQIRAGGGAGTWRGPVYAVGQLAPQFPSLGVEKEFAQLTRGATGRLVEAELLREVLSDPDNRFFGRHLCWVFTTQQVDAFVVLPREDADVTRLVELLPSGDSDDVVHVVVGRSVSPGALDSPCPESGLPMVVADQLLAFTLDEFAAALPDSDAETDSERAPSAPGIEPAADGGGGSREQFQAVVRDVFHRLTRRADNYGISEEHRALNYVALRYPPLYHAVAQAFDNGKMLVGVHARHGHSSTRRLVSVVLTFRHRRTEITERYQCLVDVSEVFPFMVTRLQPVYD